MISSLSFKAYNLAQKKISEHCPIDCECRDSLMTSHEDQWYIIHTRLRCGVKDQGSVD